MRIEKTRKIQFIPVKVCSVLMAIALLVTSVVPVNAATARATTMKLEKTEGTVTLKNQNGTKRKITKGMRLYNGNSLTTSSDSFAYVSLDDSKAVKLNEKSSATLRQSGKRLELLLKKGELFFDVSEPLTDSESMNIRTTTMVTGVRGTCGIVQVVSPQESKLYLLEGEVVLTDSFGTKIVVGGQIATAQTTSEQEYLVTIEKMTEADVPIFAIVEILNDPKLQEKIEQTTELRVEKLEEVYQESQNPSDSEEGGTDDSSQGEDSDDSQTSNPYYPGTSTPSVPASELTGTVTINSVQKSLDSSANTTVTLAKGSSLSISSGESITVPAGKTLVVSGSVTGYGTVNVGSDGTAASLTVEAGGSIEDATVVLESGSTLTNNGTVDNSILELGTGSTLTNNGSIDGTNLTSSGGATITNNGQIDLDGAYTNSGTADTYVEGEDAVLVSGSESTAMPEGSLLASCADPSLYVYADSLDSTALSAISEIGTSNVVFAKDAEVEGSLTAKGANWDLGTYALSISSGQTFTLEETNTISGSGDKTIDMAGGNLNLSGTGGSIVNSGSGYAVAISNSASAINWSDSAFAIKQTSAENTIQGIKVDNDNIVSSQSCVISPAKLEYLNGEQLAFVPSTLTEIVSVARINAALESYDKVTVGAAKLEGSISITRNKTLELTGEVTGIETLDLSDSATLTITENGSLNCTSIQLDTASLTNYGIISADSIISSTGGAKVNNEGQITLEGAYSNEGMANTYSSENGILISGTESNALANDAVLLAHTEEGSKYIYAGSLSSAVLLETQGYTLVFDKDAEVTEELNAENISWNMDTHALIVATGGALTLSGKDTITGSGEKVVYLNGGTLTLEGSDTIIGNGADVVYLNGGTLNLNGSGSITNESKNSGTYTIAVSDTSTGTLNWNSIDFMLVNTESGAKDVQFILQGAKLDGNSNVVSLDYLSVGSDNYKVYWDAKSKLMLQKIA